MPKLQQNIVATNFADLMRNNQCHFQIDEKADSDYVSQLTIYISNDENYTPTTNRKYVEKDGVNYPVLSLQEYNNIFPKDSHILSTPTWLAPQPYAVIFPNSNNFNNLTTDEKQAFVDLLVTKYPSYMLYGNITQKNGTIEITGEWDDDPSIKFKGDQEFYESLKKQQRNFIITHKLTTTKDFELKTEGKKLTIDVTLPDGNITHLSVREIRFLSPTQQQAFIDNLIDKYSEEKTYVSGSSLKISKNKDGESQLYAEPNVVGAIRTPINVPNEVIAVIEQIAPENLIKNKPTPKHDIRALDTPPLQQQQAPQQRHGVGETFAQLMERGQCVFSYASATITFLVSSDDKYTGVPRNFHTHGKDGKKYPILSQDEYKNIINSSEYLKTLETQNKLDTSVNTLKKADQLLEFTGINGTGFLCYDIQAEAPRYSIASQKQYNGETLKFSTEEESAFVELIAQHGYPLEQDLYISKYEPQPDGNYGTSYTKATTRPDLTGAQDPRIIIGHHTDENLSLPYSDSLFDKILTKQNQLRAGRGNALPQQQQAPQQRQNVGANLTALEQQDQQRQSNQPHREAANLFKPETVRAFHQFFSDNSEGARASNWAITPAALKNADSTYEQIEQAIQGNQNKIDVKLDDTENGAAFTIHQDKITIPDTVAEDKKVESYEGAANALQKAGFPLVEISAPYNDEATLKQAFEGVVKAGGVPVVKPYPGTENEPSARNLHRDIEAKTMRNLSQETIQTYTQAKNGLTQRQKDLKDRTLRTYYPERPLTNRPPVRPEGYNYYLTNTAPHKQKNEKSVILLSKLFTDNNPFEHLQKTCNTLLGGFYGEYINHCPFLNDEQKGQWRNKLYESADPSSTWGSFHTEFGSKIKSNLTHMQNFFGNSNHFFRLYDDFFEANEELKLQLNAIDTKEQDLVFYRDDKVSNNSSAFYSHPKQKNKTVMRDGKKFAVISKGENLVARALQDWNNAERAKLEGGHPHAPRA